MQLKNLFKSCVWYNWSQHAGNYIRLYSIHPSVRPSVHIKSQTLSLSLSLRSVTNLFSVSPVIVSQSVWWRTDGWSQAVVAIDPLASVFLSVNHHCFLTTYPCVCVCSGSDKDLGLWGVCVLLLW